MSRRHIFARRCSFESLENRRMLAGDVTAKISNGDLVIKGDELGNGIAITAGATAGSVVVTGVDAAGSATIVNGTSNGAVTLSGFTGELKIKMKGGDDTVSITGLTVSGDARIRAGRGNDIVSISGSTFDRSLTTELGNGDDTLKLASTTVSDRTKVTGHPGDDNASITNSTLSDLSVSLGRGNDSLTISGTTASGKATLNGRSGVNTFTDAGGNSLANLKVKHFNQTTTTTPSNTLSLNSVPAISENAQAALTGSFTDNDLTDSHTVTINWNDPNKSANSTFTVPGTSSLTANQSISSSTDSAMLTVTSISGGQVNFSVQHQYLNDGAAPGNFTNSDDSTITVTVTGGNGFNRTAKTTVTVNNVGPKVTPNSVAAVNENSSATLTGNFTDPGLLDGHSLAVNWGDPNNAASSTFTVPAIENAAGTATLNVNQTINSTTDGAVLTIASINTATGQVGFSVQHRYLDDGPAGGNGTASDPSSISVSVTDLDGQSGANTTSVTVNDVAPTVAGNAPSNVAVNGTATLTGTFTDIGLLDQHPVLVSWGDGAVPQFLVPAIRSAAGAATLTVNQTINSSDNTAVLTITSVDSTTGQVGFSVQHVYTASGKDLTILISVLDDDTLMDTASTTITVS